MAEEDLAQVRMHNGLECGGLARPDLRRELGIVDRNSTRRSRCFSGSLHLCRFRGDHNLVAELQKKAGPQELIENPLVVGTGRIEGA